MEFAVVIAMIATAAVVVQYRVRSVIEDSVFTAAQEVMGQPTTTTPGRFQPRACLDNSGDGLCDCMDTNRDGSCDGLSADSGSSARESGPAAGRTTLLTESSTGSSQLENVQITPIAGPPPGIVPASTGGRTAPPGSLTGGRAIPRGSSPSSSSAMAPTTDSDSMDSSGLASGFSSAAAGQQAPYAPASGVTGATVTGPAQQPGGSSSTRVVTSTPLAPPPVLPMHVVIPEQWD